jgi:hypothetical protein
MASKRAAGNSAKMKRKAYEKELRKLQVELCRLQDWVKEKGARIIILFEGRDAAGKGGTIKALTMSPELARCMVRPCVARGVRRSGGFAVLHQCIRLLIGACCAPSHHGYQRACGLIKCQASTGPFVPPVFACAGKTDPPSRLILSQTPAGKRLWDYVIDSSLSCVYFMQFLCSCR